MAWAALLLAGPLALALSLLLPSLKASMWPSPAGHLLISGAASLLGILMALMVLRAAKRSEDGRVFLVGMGFLGTASIFFIHAIATPNVVMQGRGIATAWSAPLSLVVGGVMYAASGFDLSPALNRRLMRATRLWLAVFFACWLAYAAVVLLAIPAAHTAHGHSSPVSDALLYGGDEYASAPVRVEAGPTAGPAPSLGLGDLARQLLYLFGAVCYGLAIERHYRLYRRAPAPASPAVLCGVVLFAEALLAQYFAPLYSAAFWLYHMFEFVGFGVVVVGVLQAFKRGLPGQSLLEGLFLSGTRSRMQAAYAAAMDDLVETLSRGQQPPAALRAVLRDDFAMSESQVQVLERAALAIAEERRQRQELERLNAELRRIEQDRDNLTQMVVHDLQNPLTALIGFLEIMRVGPLDDDQRDYLARALQSGRSLAALIRDLLDIGQLQAGQLLLEPFQIDLAHLLADCAAETEAWAAQGRKLICVDVQPGLPFFAADLRLMRRVLLNLISNAIKHTPAETRITLRARLRQQGEASPLLVLEVEDNGPGIAPELAARIFDRYVRGSSDRPDSTGLGLTFCKLAVEAHGGAISVESPRGGGTVFRMLLPLRQIGLADDGETLILSESVPPDR